MANRTSVANGALVKLGQDLINSITDENDKAARLCNERLDNAKEVVLSSYPFSGAITRTILVPTTDVPAFNYDNSFQIPADCLRILTIQPHERDTDYKLEGDRILYSGTDLDFIYVSNITDYNLLQPIANETISCYLAYDIAYAISNDNQVVDRMYQLYEKTRARAIASNNRELKREEFFATDWIDARLLGSYPSRFPAPER